MRIAADSVSLALQRVDYLNNPANTSLTGEVRCALATLILDMERLARTMDALYHRDKESHVFDSIWSALLGVGESSLITGALAVLPICLNNMRGVIGAEMVEDEYEHAADCTYWLMGGLLASFASHLAPLYKKTHKVVANWLYDSATRLGHTDVYAPVHDAKDAQLPPSKTVLGAFTLTPTTKQRDILRATYTHLRSHFGIDSALDEVRIYLHDQLGAACNVDTVLSTWQAALQRHAFVAVLAAGALAHHVNSETTTTSATLLAALRLLDLYTTYSYAMPQHVADGLIVTRQSVWQRRFSDNSTYKDICAQIAFRKSMHAFHIHTTLCVRHSLLYWNQWQRMRRTCCAIQRWQDWRLQRTMRKVCCQLNSHN